jgi:hypothetical protein
VFLFYNNSEVIEYIMNEYGILCNIFKFNYFQIYEFMYDLKINKLLINTVNKFGILSLIAGMLSNYSEIIKNDFYHTESIFIDCNMSEMNKIIMVYGRY